MLKEEWENALIQRHGKELFERLSRASVAVCGLGGLGSAIAVMLARMGVGRLVLIDFDRVDITNIHRQQYKTSQTGKFKTEALAENIYEIAPYIALKTHNVRMGSDNSAELLCDCDIVCEAFDNAQAKSMLVNTLLETFDDKYIVASSGMAGLGSANAISTRRITQHFYLCGDGVSDIESEGSLFASRVMLCACHQAHTVLRIIAEQYEV